MKPTGNLWLLFPFTGDANLGRISIHHLGLMGVRRFIMVVVCQIWAEAA